VAVFVSDVINLGLEQVIIPSWLCSEVVVSAACTLTTTSMLGWKAAAAMGRLSREGVCLFPVTFTAVLSMVE